jgi:3-oxoacyl-[acyl-carrier protein] reductase
LANSPGESCWIIRRNKRVIVARLGKPEDIAAAVAFLAGPDGASINGQTLRANGGII